MNSFVLPNETRFSTSIEPSTRGCARRLDDPISAFVTTTVVTPVATMTAAPTIAVFAFIHAISFNAPFTRSKVELPTAAPLAAAAAVTVTARPTGAACTEFADTAPAMSAVVLSPGAKWPATRTAAKGISHGPISLRISRPLRLDLGFKDERQLPDFCQGGPRG